MDGNLLQQGLTLMLVGMGTVFVFLTALVIAMRLLSLFAAKFQPKPAPAGGPTDEEVAAIAAAIALHRKR